MIRLTENVRMQGVQVPMLLVMQQAGDFATLKRHQCIWVTSVVDGDHMEGSLHYAGAAVDLCIAENHKDHGALADFLARNLTRDFDVIDELDHVHVEYQPKRP